MGYGIQIKVYNSFVNKILLYAFNQNIKNTVN